MSNPKGGLIKKKKPTLQPPAPVIKTQAADFSYSTSTTPAPVEVESKQTIIQQPVSIQHAIQQEKPKKPQPIGKKNSKKSFKVPSEIHTQINLLGSFMDENVAYMILQRLIDSYVTNELSNRQQRQFEFMFEASKEEN